jgi:putative ABC transport system permease protein
MLFGVRPGDPLTFALVVMVLLATAVLAIVGPALRAARIDPAVTLRA